VERFLGILYGIGFAIDKLFGLRILLELFAIIKNYLIFIFGFCFVFLY
jgi:hypothetical protein